MCGIVAHFAADSETADAALVNRAASRLKHRGPDGEGFGSLGRASLGHTRLAIVDLAGGEQPMGSQAYHNLMVCNGEIYNHQKLREALTPRHTFSSQCDSEVILHLYEEVGVGCLPLLDGMFAFFISDGDGFLAARDPYGIKPLYYGRSADGSWLFASETKVVAEDCRTFTALEPGHLITEAGVPRRWFQRDWEQHAGTQRQVEPGELAQRFEAAVGKRLMSDVPLGVFLSGGLDSSIVAEVAARHYTGLQTFSVGMLGASDLAAARVVAEALGTRHHERVYTLQDAARCLPDVIRHLESYDTALIRSAIPCYLLSQLAAEHVKIALTGEGADELFGGYGYFAGMDSPQSFHAECVRLLLGLHGMNLQRVDRMTMAHGLEGRVPFLDADFVDFAMGIAPPLKMWQHGGDEKGLLRAAFAERLPNSIVRRRKLEFSKGSGIEPGLRGLADQRISDRDLASAAARFPLDPPATKEDLLYREIFHELFPGEAHRAGVSRWRPPVGPQLPN